MTSWAATQAKAQFSAVLDKAESEGPQLVQRRKKRFILLTEEELNVRTRSNLAPAGKADRPSLWDLLRFPPGKAPDVEFPRVRSKARWVKF